MTRIKMIRAKPKTSGPRCALRMYLEKVFKVVAVFRVCVYKDAQVLRDLHVYLQVALSGHLTNKYTHLVGIAEKLAQSSGWYVFCVTSP